MDKKTLYSTKNTGGGVKAGLVLGGILLFLLEVILFSSGIFFEVLKQSTYTREDEIASIIKCFSLLLPFVGGFFLIYQAFVWSKTYLDVYSDHIEGNGIYAKNKCSQFHILKHKITNVTTEGAFLRIHTESGTYKVLTSKRRAKEIFSFLNSERNIGGQV